MTANQFPLIGGPLLAVIAFLWPSPPWAEDIEKGIADQLPRWNRAGGRVLPGLTRRRAAERALFLTECEAPA